MGEILGTESGWRSRGRENSSIISQKNAATLWVYSHSYATKPILVPFDYKKSKGWSASCGGTKYAEQAFATYYNNRKKGTTVHLWDLHDGKAVRRDEPLCIMDDSAKSPKKRSVSQLLGAGTGAAGAIADQPPEAAGANALASEVAEAFYGGSAPRNVPYVPFPESRP